MEMEQNDTSIQSPEENCRAERSLAVIENEASSCETSFVNEEHVASDPKT